MYRLFSFLLILLGLGLPLHGALTVFLPPIFRFWKEGVLGVLFFLVLWLEIQATWKNWGQKKHWRDFLKKIQATWAWPEILAKVFLLWGVFLVLINEDIKTAAMAFRYLGLGFLVYLIFARLLRHFQAPISHRLLNYFSLAFIGGNLVSVLFGTWAKFFGGFEVLKNYYANTVSSWVPGQTVTIYHEAGNMIRMQGASSGPIEFSHLLVAALFLLLIDKHFSKVWQILFGIILIFGIYQSYSRAAIFGASIILLGFAIYKSQITMTPKNLKNIILSFLGIGVLLISSVFFIPSLREPIFSRAGTSDHITRPIEAFKTGLTRPFLGDLGALGPAARTKNLEILNNDQALIAENVFIDYFAQTGIIGLILVFCFFGSLCFLWWQNKKTNLIDHFTILGFMISFVLMMNLATIFDMTPLSISFFLILAFLQPENIQEKAPRSAFIHDCVNNLGKS